MATNQLLHENLYKAFAMFIEAFRPYVVLTLMKEAGDKWPAWFVEALYPAQRETWNIGLKAGTSPEALIDYPHLKSFVLKYKDLLRSDFGRDINKVASRLETIYDIRNKLAHFKEITEDEFSETMLNMKSISRSIKMDVLESGLAQLQEIKQPVIVKISPPTTERTSPLVQGCNTTY